MPKRQRYTKQFKEEALRLVRQEGVSLTQVARDLGINAGMQECHRPLVLGMVIMILSRSIEILRPFLTKQKGIEEVVECQFPQSAGST